MVEKIRRKFMLTVFVLVALLLLIGLVSINAGYTDLSLTQVLQTLIGRGSVEERLILFQFRMPRMVLAMLVGAGLAVSGCVFQAVTKNDLASPSLLGVNAGAGLAVLLYIFFRWETSISSIFALPVVALIGASLTSLLIFGLVYGRRGQVSTYRLILTGIALSSGIDALSIIFTIRLSAEQYSIVNTWTIGSVWGTSWEYVLALLPWIMVLIPFFICRAQRLNVLRLSDHVAIGLGADLHRERFLFLMLAVALAAACVAVGGAIGFVGLICPHLAKKLVSPNHQYALVLSALVGAVLLAGADLISRTIIQPNEIPLGIVVAFIGAPYFLYLLVKSPK